MKRLFACIVLICVIVFATTVTAEEIDLTSLSTEDLIVLNDRINAELGAREAIGGILRDGDYVVGSDIAPGSYDVIYLDSNMARIHVLVKSPDGKVFDGGELAEGDSIHITVADSDCISVGNGSLVLIPTQMIGSK